MTLGGRLAALFPSFHLLLILLSLYALISRPSGVAVAVALSAVYLVPVGLFRLHELFFPLKEGVTDLSLSVYNPWWTSHQLQMTFMAIPWLEGVLHLVPGLFSLWLRLWGSRVGSRVHWTPKVEIVDRSLVDIGDRAVIGHLSAFCSHLVTPIDGRASLLVRKVKVGRHAVVGGKVGLGPGTEVKDGELVKFGTTLYWKGTFE